MAARGFDFLPPHDLVARPIAAFYENVREQARNHSAWGQCVENDDSINGFQGREDFRALKFRDNWSTLAFQLADARITIEPDDQNITELAGKLQRANMTGMEQVEAAIGKYDAAAIAFLPAKQQNRFVQCENSSVQRSSMPAHDKVPANATKNIVYHAWVEQQLRPRSER